MNFVISLVASVKNAEYYDQFMAEHWHHDLQYVNYRVERIKELVDRFVPNDSRVLEIGCGNGLVTRHLAKRAKSVMAIDASPKAIENAKRYVSNVNCTFQVADILYDNIAGIYDVIVMADVIEHIEKHSRRWIINQIERYLLPHGMVILTWPHPDVQGESNQIVEESVSIYEILSMTRLQLFYFSYVDVDYKNHYVHCILKRRVDISPMKRDLSTRLLNPLKKLSLRMSNFHLLKA